MTEELEWHALSSTENDSLLNIEEQKLFPVECGGKKICIVKIQGAYYAINNRCPHAGTPFHLGTCNKKGTVVCPTHHYKFDVKTGLSADGNHYKIPTFKIKEENLQFFVGIRK